jgi:hypothetical protein
VALRLYDRYTRLLAEQGARPGARIQAQWHALVASGPGTAG